MKNSVVTNSQFKTKMVMTLCYMALMITMGVYSQLTDNSSAAHKQHKSSVELSNSSATIRR